MSAVVRQNAKVCSKSAEVQIKSAIVHNQNAKVCSKFANVHNTPLPSPVSLLQQPLQRKSRLIIEPALSDGTFDIIICWVDFDIFAESQSGKLFADIRSHGDT